MIPTGPFTDDWSDFTSPYDLPYSRLSDTVRGGIAIGDGSQGRDVKNWTASYDEDAQVINVYDTDESIVLTVPEPELTELSVAFDPNMSIVLAWLSGTTAKLRYFDTAANAFVIREFPGVTSCKVRVDDVSYFYNSKSDVIFSYTDGNQLVYLLERESYNVVHVVGETSMRIRRCGMNIKRKFQYEMR